MRSQLLSFRGFSEVHAACCLSRRVRRCTAEGGSGGACAVRALALSPGEDVLLAALDTNQLFSLRLVTNDQACKLPKHFPDHVRTAGHSMRTALAMATLSVEGLQLVF